MSGLEVNKIIASIIFAVLVVTIIGHLGDLIIDTEHHDSKEKKRNPITSNGYSKK